MMTVSAPAEMYVPRPIRNNRVVEAEGGEGERASERDVIVSTARLSITTFTVKTSEWRADKFGTCTTDDRRRRPQVNLHSEVFTSRGGRKGWNGGTHAVDAADNFPNFPPLSSFFRDDAA